MLQSLLNNFLLNEFGTIWPCVDNNDNQMTFVGHIVYLCPSVASFALSLRSGANDATRPTNKLYAIQKSCDVLFIIVMTTLQFTFLH